MDTHNLVTIKEIEGVLATHDNYLKHEMAKRSEPFEYLDDVTKLAEYIGGVVESIKPGDWAIGKELFPGVNVHFVYQHGDDEFPSNLRLLFNGDRAKAVPGEDLVGIVIGYVNHMLRYIRETNSDKQLPQVCYQV